MSGMTTQQAINTVMPTQTPKGPIDNADSSRQLMYTGSERTSHKGFKKTRRRLTYPPWGRCAASSRPPHGPAQRFHPLEFDELGRRCPQIVAVEERLERRAVHRQRPYLGIGARFVEKWDGHALQTRADHAMLGCLDSAAAPALEHLAEIDRKTVIGRRYIEPGTVAVARLQTRDPVLSQQSQKSRVDMRCAIDVEPSPVTRHPDVRIRLRRLFRV